MLRVNAHAEFVDDFEGRRIDHPNVVGATVGHVDARKEAYPKGFGPLVS